MLPAELPAVIGGRYRTVREIGRGGMGVVIEVEHIHTGARLALKLLVAQSNASGQTVERFKREARASAQINSEHVVRVTDADVAPELGNAPFVVMELLEGSDLDVFAGAEPQPSARVIGWLRQVARGLDKAHRLGIIHRDLKPANLFLTSREDGTPLVKILDFGIAKVLDAAGGATTTGEVLGTPLYMAPEQARATEALTGAVDRYALGLIAYRLLFGRVYWRTNGIVQIINEILYLPYDAPSSRESTYGPRFDAWFAQAVAPDPTRRFPTAAEEIEALAAALDLDVLPLSDPTATPDREASRTGPSTKTRAQASFELSPTVPISATLSGARRETTLWGSKATRLGAIGLVAAALLAGTLVIAARPKTGGPAPAVGAPVVATGIAVAASPPTPEIARDAETPPTPPTIPAPSEPAAKGGGGRDAGRASPKPKVTPSAAASVPALKSAPTVDPFGDQK